MGNVSIAAVSLTGQKHSIRGIPCEDFSIAIHMNDVSVVILADGAGGKSYTHARFGAKACCEEVSELLIYNFDALYNENREAAARAAIVSSVHARFADMLVEHHLTSIERFSCTMSFVAIKDRRVLIGHIGDGVIAKVTSSGISPITMPQNGEISSQTYFITAPHASDYLRFYKTTIDDTHAFCLMTDGVQDMVYDDDSGLVKPVVAKMAESAANGNKTANDELSEIITKHIINASSTSDDCSFGIVYFDDTKVPDFSSMPTSAEPFAKPTVTFKELQREMKPIVKRARSIIMDKASNEKVKLDGVKRKPKTNREKLYRSDSLAEINEDKLIDLRASQKNVRRFLTVLSLVELIVICCLVFFLYHALG